MNAVPKFTDDHLEEIDMETRIAKIESDVEHIKQDVKHIQLDVHELQLDLKAANENIKDLQGDVRVINATLPHLATKEDLSKAVGALTEDNRRVEGKLGTEIKRVEGELKTEIKAVEGRLGSMEARLVGWFIATAVALASLAFGVAKWTSGSVPPSPAPAAATAGEIIDSSPPAAPSEP